jgi:glycerophosphoryl diester phosphodiesterase
LGIAVYPWTVDSGEDMARLLKMKVDGIITNRPDVLLNLLGKP